ncbi:ROK family protein [Microlunatus sp. GCM10028923]|uniref:ROK family protein n=1 Tax=Microlunatus sp. GCM10028923 TaxID=3273400 RepID=UPI00360F43B5
MAESALSRPRPTTESQLIQLLILKGPVHRAEIARHLGLSRSRVSSVVSSLLAQDIVEETQNAGEAYGKVDGRSGPAITMAARLGAVGGVQITTTNLHVAVVSLSGDVLAEDRQGLLPGLSPSEILSAARSVLDRSTAAAGIERLAIAGVGVFGQIDRVSGVVSTHPASSWWQVNAAELAIEALDVPAVVENNSRLEALAEASWGAGQQFDPVLYLQLGHGMTASLIVSGEVIRGAGGGAGELAHLSIDFDGRICPCGGRGCLQQYASAEAVHLAVRERVGGSWSDVMLALEAGDRAVHRAFQDAAEILGRAIAGLANLLDPARIVIGGELVRAGESFVGRIADCYQDYALPGSAGADLVVGRYQGLGRGGALAAALLARRHLAGQVLDLVLPTEQQTHSPESES